jgi:hypothetical protein
MIQFTCVAAQDSSAPAISSNTKGQFRNSYYMEARDGMTSKMPQRVRMSAVEFTNSCSNRLGIIFYIILCSSRSPRHFYSFLLTFTGCHQV